MAKRVGKAKGRTVVPCGKGVFLVARGDRPERLEVRDFRLLEPVLGARLFPAIVRVFNGAERLDTLAHLVLMTYQHVDPKRLPLAYARNLRTAFFLIFGAMYECKNALQKLKAAGVKSHVAESSKTWRSLSLMHARWEKSEILGTMRHGFAHHLGSTEDIERGLDHYRSGKTMVLFETHGETRHENGFPFVSEILLRGSGIQQDEFEVFHKQAIEDAASFSALLQNLLMEILAHHGVRFPGDVVPT